MKGDTDNSFINKLLDLCREDYKENPERGKYDICVFDVCESS